MKLKNNLLYEIFHLNNSVNNKYSKAYLNLKTVFELEELEGFKIPSTIINKFNQISKKYSSFISNIPLIVIEKYFYQNISNLNKFIYITYKDNEIQSIKVSDIYYELEGFFNDVFMLCSLIANYYNIEIKINKNMDNDEDNVKYL